MRDPSSLDSCLHTFARRDNGSPFRFLFLFFGFLSSSSLSSSPPPLSSLSLADGAFFFSSLTALILSLGASGVLGCFAGVLVVVAPSVNRLRMGVLNPILLLFALRGGVPVTGGGGPRRSNSLGPLEAASGPWGVAGGLWCCWASAM